MRAAQDSAWRTGKPRSATMANENPPEPFPRAGLAERCGALSTAARCRRSRGRTACTSSRCCRRSRSRRTGGGRASGGRSAVPPWKNFAPPWKPPRKPPPCPPPALAHRRLVAIEAVASAATASAAVMSFLVFIIVSSPGSVARTPLPSLMSGTVETGRPARCDGHHENADFGRYPLGRRRRTYCGRGESSGIMTRLRDLIRREPRRGLSHSAVARPAALGRHRVDRPAGRAAPALRQRRGLCGRVSAACPTS